MNNFKKYISNNTFANIVISVCIGLSYYFLDGTMELKRPGYNPTMGYVLLSVILIALPFGVIKTKDLSLKKKDNISRVELFLIAMLFFAGFFTTILAVYMGCSLIENRSSFSDEMLIVFCVIGGLAVIAFLIECWYIFIAQAKESPNKIWVYLSNWIVPLYCGISIAILWEGAFDVNWEAAPVDFRKITLSAIMALILILPFQRLFWFESFADSTTGKESSKSVTSILLSWCIAVIGVL